MALPYTVNPIQQNNNKKDKIDKFISTKEDKDSSINFIEQVNDNSKEYDKIQILLKF